MSKPAYIYRQWWKMLFCLIYSHYYHLPLTHESPSWGTEPEPSAASASRPWSHAPPRSRTHARTGLLLVSPQLLFQLFELHFRRLEMWSNEHESPVGHDRQRTDRNSPSQGEGVTVRQSRRLHITGHLKERAKKSAISKCLVEVLLRLLQGSVKPLAQDGPMRILCSRRSKVLPSTPGLFSAGQAGYRLGISRYQ